MIISYVSWHSWMFLVQKMLKNSYQKKHKKIRTPGPSPLFLGPSPIFYQFFYGFLYISFHLESFHYVASNFEKVHFVFALSLADVDVYLCFPHKLLLTPSSSLRQLLIGPLCFALIYFVLIFVSDYFVGVMRVDVLPCSRVRQLLISLLCFALIYFVLDDVQVFSSSLQQVEIVVDPTSLLS